MNNHREMYEIIASNGQVLEHGFISQEKCQARIREYLQSHPGDNFTMSGYDRGKYGNE